MTLSQLRELDLVKATTKELEAGIKASYSLNKRLQHLSKAKNVSTVAYDRAMKSGGYFGFTFGNLPYPKESVTPNQYRAALQKEVARAQEFMGSKTSTVKGAREVYKNQTRTLFGDDKEVQKAFNSMDEDKKKEFIRDFWKEYERFKEEHPIYDSETPFGRTYTQKETDEQMKIFRELYFGGLRGQELVDRMAKMMDAVVEREEAEERRKADEDRKKKWGPKWKGTI